MLIDARLTGWFGVSLYTLPWVSPNITKLSLLAAPYSITSSTKVDELWSSIFCDFHLLNFIYSGTSRKRHLWAFPRASCINCLNMCRILTGSVSGWGCHFVFRAPFDSIYTSVFLSSPFYCRSRERAYCAENLAPFVFLHPFIETVTSSRDRLLGKSFFFSPIYHFIAL